MDFSCISIAFPDKLIVEQERLCAKRIFLMKEVLMKILMIYPEYPRTFWSFHYALKFVSKKASFPPLGLMTVAALLPKEWENKLVDMNVSKLKDKDIKWADYVFISAMMVQKDSVNMVIDRCKNLGVKTVAGGPLFTTDYADFNHVDHLILNEAEITMPLFLNDLKNGEAKHIYMTDELADIKNTPLPLRNLINMKKYSSMNIQYSRGCPFNCDFCNITQLYGHTPRIKTNKQIIDELNDLYNMGWKGGVFFVDDNFIGNKKELKKEILPSIIEWMKKKNYPFAFATEASINLSDDEDLIDLMVQAGFDTVFVGIETTNEDSLSECSKFQNKNRDLIASVKKIQEFGLNVQGGFIVGFDNDPASIFQHLIDFIQESAIVEAMVGLLNAPKGTKLYQRMKSEGRLLNNMTGDNTDMTINFVPKMDYDLLIKGYRNILSTIYSPKHYYKRVSSFLKKHKPFEKKAVNIKMCDVKALIKSIIRLGILGKERIYYWKLFFWSLFRRPELFPIAITYMIYGFHFRKIYEKY